MEVISILKNKATEDIVEDVKRLCKVETTSTQNKELYLMLKNHFSFRKDELEQRNFYNKNEIMSILTEVIKICEQQVARQA